LFEFLAFLWNPWILLLIVSPLLLVLGLVLGNIFSQPRRNRVLKVDPESHRGVELEVKSEDAVNIYCNAVGKMPPQRFIKRLNPFNILRKGWLKLQNYAMWFGRYGTAYVHELGKEDVLVSFRQAVSNVFGDYYKQIPDAVKNQIEDGKLGVIIKFPNNPLTPTGVDGKPLPSISEDDVNRDNDERAMKNLWQTFEREQKRSVVDRVALIGMGIGIGVILCLLFRWGAPIVVSPTP